MQAKTRKWLLLGLLLICLSIPRTSAVAQTSTSAKACVVVEQSTGRVLFAKNANEQLPMASTTKIVTALTVLQNCQNLHQIVEIPAQAVGVEGSSIYLKQGEKLSVLQLLYGLMLRSGNDSAVALAIHVGGSVPNFVEMMNDVAQQNGCVNTHFDNPHGLHSANHYTSASDLAKLTCVAMNNADFCKIVSTKQTTIPNETQSYPRVLTNKNKLLFNMEGANGVKTGYTKKAGRCFVGSAKLNGMQVVCVVLNCGPMFEETQQLLQNATATFSMKCLVPLNKVCGVVFVRGKPTYYYCPQAFYYPLCSSDVVERKILLDNQPCVQVFVNGEKVANCHLSQRELSTSTCFQVLFSSFFFAFIR